VERTEQAYAALLRRDPRVLQHEAETRARTISAIMFLAMAASVNTHLSVEEIVQEIRQQTGALLTR
ncbi:MAG TPA: TetR/AcrR family transcriptional regulator, partial [Mycobacterium sp.]